MFRLVDMTDDQLADWANLQGEDVSCETYDSETVLVRADGRVVAKQVKHRPTQSWQTYVEVPDATNE